MWPLEQQQLRSAGRTKRPLAEDGVEMQLECSWGVGFGRVEVGWKARSFQRQLQVAKPKKEQARSDSRQACDPGRCG